MPERLPEPALEVLHRLSARQPIGSDLLRTGFGALLRAPHSRARDCALGSLLVGLMTRGPEVDEAVAVLQAIADLDGIRLADRPVAEADSPYRVAIVQGSGKKGIKTGSVSTPSCLLAAAAGAPVLKVGSRGGGALTGAYDFLEAVGFNVDNDVPAMMAALRRVGFAFYNSAASAPVFFQTYKGLFHFGHILMFGISPILAPVQGGVNVYGIAHPDVEFSVRVLLGLGHLDAWVVASTHDEIHYLDEVGIFGRTAVAAVADGRPMPVMRFEPAVEFGLGDYHGADILEAPTPVANVRAAVRALAGNGSRAHADLLCANAALILRCTGVVEGLRAGFQRARACLDAGDGLAMLQRAVTASGGSAGQLASYL